MKTYFARRLFAGAATVLTLGACDYLAYDTTAVGIGRLPEMSEEQIPSRSFTMGCAQGSSHECGADAPAHSVNLSAFLLDAYETTQAQYKACLDHGTCTAPDCGCSASDPSCLWNPWLKGNLPVVCLTWEQAAKYCEWRGRRLPTEAEWELAARGDGTDPSRNPFPWGTDDPECKSTNFLGCVAKAPRKGGGARGDFPVFNMVGNVREWVADWYAPNGYLEGSPDNPTGPSDGRRRVVRGGSYMSPIEELYTYRRDSQNPTDALRDVGVRCAGSVP